MTYRFLADAVLLLPATFIAFVMLGGFAALRWPRLAWLHVPAVAWGAGIVGMLTASASYHRLPRSERTAKVLRRLDHAAIWGAVAGTWTPIALAVLPGRAGTIMAGTMWGAGVSAAVAKTAYRLGIASKLDANPSLASGTSEVSLIELTAARRAQRQARGAIA